MPNTRKRPSGARKRPGTAGRPPGESTAPPTAPEAAGTPGEPAAAAGDPPETAPEGEAVAHRLPAPLTAALALTGFLGIALSGAPQLVLRFTETGLF